MEEESPRTLRSKKFIFHRYLWLMSLIYDRDGITFDEISYRWQHCDLNPDETPLPKRTFQDHLRAIEELFDVLFECKDNYRYYIVDRDDIQKDVVRSWMLDNFSVNNALSEAKGIKERIYFQEIPSSKRWLSTIIQAIREKRVLELDYHSFQKGKVPTLRICPFFVKLYDNRWYLYARKENEATMKHYALDRIDNINVLDETFDFEPTDEDFYNIEHCFGHSIYPDKKPQWIRVRAKDAAAEYMDTLPLHPTQRCVEKGEGYSIYEFRVARTAEFDAELRKWGSQLKVVE